MGPAPFVLIAAGLAGATALASQLLWMRAFDRSVGATSALQATLFSMFVIGVGLGALASSKVAGRSARPARVAAVLLLLAGIWVAVSPALLDQLPDWQVALGTPPGAVSAMLLAALLVLVPSALFGALFPLFVRSRVFELPHAAGRAGRLYASQALGAGLAAGALFVLLPAVGETMLLRFAGATALVGALLLLIADRPLPHGSGPPPEGQLGRPFLGAAPAVAVIMAGAALVGAETAWFEAFEPLVGSRPLALTLQILVVTGSLAFGLTVGGRVANRLKRVDLAFGIALAIAGYLLLLPLPLIGRIPTQLLAAGNPSGGTRVLALVWGMLPVIGPPVFFLGALFPLAVGTCAGWSGQAAGAAGRVYAWEAAGHVLGALLVGLVLGPLVGASGSVMCLGILSVAVAAGIRLFAKDASRAVPALVIALPLVLWMWPGVLATWRDATPSLPEVLATQRPLPPGLTIEDRDDTQLYAALFVGRAGQAGRSLEGPVDVLHGVDRTDALYRGGERIDVVSVDGGGTLPRASVAMGLLPALLHPQPRHALISGFGAGHAVRGALAARVAHVDVAEPDPGIVAAAEALLPETGRTLDDGRVALHLTDARTWLRGTETPYDFIATDDTALLTLEGLEIARSALDEDGIFVLRYDLDSWDAATLRTALATIRARFDRVWVWRFADTLLLVAFKSEPDVQAGRWRSTLASIGPGRVLARAAGISSPGDLLRHFALDTEGVDRIAAQRASTYRDDRPAAERDRALLRLEPRGRDDGVHGLLETGFPPNFDAVVPNPETREAWLAAATAAWLDVDSKVAEAWYRNVRFGVSAEGLRVRARVARSLGDTRAAARMLGDAIERAPRRGDLAAERIVVLPVALEGTSTDEIIAAIEKLRIAFPNDGRVQAAAGSAYQHLGHLQRGHDAFVAALDADDPPPPEGTGLNLARLMLSSDNPEDDVARTRMEADPALYEDPDALGLYIGLLDPKSHAERSGDLDDVLSTLERDRALSAEGRAREALGAGPPQRALERAVAWTQAAPNDPQAWLVFGLAQMIARAEQGLDGGAPEAAAAPYREAIRVSADANATRETALRLMRWFGIDAEALGDSREGGTPATPGGD